MPQELPFLSLVFLLAATLPAACSLHLPTSSAADFHNFHHPRQYQWTYHKVSDDGDKDVDSSRLRDALLQLLDLNDGELRALMSGVSPRKVAPQLDSSTAFLLASSNQYLEKLITVLSIVEDSSPAKKYTWNPKIARRHKKTRRTNKHLDSKTGDFDQVSDDDPDSILGALTELSEYLSGAENKEEEDTRQQERRRRSHHPGSGRKHQTLSSKHGTKQYESHQFHYFLSTRDCPKDSEGVRMKYCPTTPYMAGEPQCIADKQLCDGTPQCPNAEDEEPTCCLFYNALKVHLETIEQVVLKHQILLQDL